MQSPEASKGLAPQHNRVILCATCYLDAEAAMNLATELAHQIGAELQGVMVRDRDSLAASGGRVSAVVSYSGVRATRVTMEDMLNAFRADARRFRDQFLRQAQDAMLSAAFQEAEGRLTEVVQSTARSGDLVVLGVKPLTQGGHDLVVVLEEGGTVPEFAKGLAHKLNKHLVAMSLSQQEQSDPLDRLDRMSPAAVILADANSDLPSLTRIIDAARCPVIVSRLSKE